MGLELELNADTRLTSEWARARAVADVGPHLGDCWIAYRRALGYRARYLLVRMTRTGSAVAVGIMYEKRSLRRPWARKEVLLDRAPWSLLPEVDPTAVVALLVEQASAQRWARFSLGSFDGPTPAADLDSMGFSVRERYEFVLDLSRSERQLWSAMKPSHRRKIRKAEKAGVTIADESPARALDLVRRMQLLTSERRTARGEHMERTNSAKFRKMARTLFSENDFSVFVARLSGRPVSAILVGTGESRAYYVMGGSNGDGLAANASSAMMWHVARQLAERGVRLFNLGGVRRESERPGSAEHGLYRFKRGFGGETLLCRSGTKTLVSAPSHADRQGF